MISNIATYFARTENASNPIAALHITPGPVGNAVGALIAGKIISRYVNPCTEPKSSTEKEEV